MTATLVTKILRDVRLALILVALLLFLFELLWARVTRNVTGQLLDRVEKQIEEMTREITKNVPLPLVPKAAPEMVDKLIGAFFEKDGQVIQKMIGGEGIDVRRASNLLTAGFIHPLIQTILCIWAIGRAAGAVAGEIDKGTMELLLAQPIERSRVILAHLIVDVATIPILCLSMWSGIWLGSAMVGLVDNPKPNMQVDPSLFGPSLLCVALLVFAVSGYTMWLSAAGRFRNRVLGLAILITLVMFLVNVIGQLLEPLEPLRPFTIFYYYHPQPMILQANWYRDAMVWLRLGVLLAVAVIGYGMAWRTFSRRDLPAPL